MGAPYSQQNCWWGLGVKTPGVDAVKKAGFMVCAFSIQLVDCVNVVSGEAARAPEI